MAHPTCSEFASLSRRRMLGGCGAGLLGLSLPQFFNLKSQAGERPTSDGFGKAKSVIVLYCWGGVSHIDTWDPKPDAPAEIRGEFRPIATRTPGIFVGEHMPLLAQQMNRLAVVRSIHHRCGAHGKGMYWNMTGHAPPAPEVAANLPPSPNDRPNIGSIVSKLCRAPQGLPGAVQIPYPLVDNNTLQAGDGPGWLGKTHAPVVLRPNRGKAYGGVSRDLGTLVLEPTQGVDAGRLRERMTLTDRLSNPLSPTTSVRSFDHFRDKAVDLLLSPKVRATLDLDREAPRMLDRYGEHICGTSMLLARRLVEAQVPLVTVVCAAGDLNGSAGDHWDTHGDNFNRLKKVLLPPLEQASSALIDDLSDRGLLDQTLVVWLTEFGRTPKVSSAGRDHYPFAYSVALAGAGIRGGQVYGSSDRIGAHPRDRACGPNDLHATIYNALGISLDTHLEDNQGRPLALTDGQPLQLY
ncbi:MAG: DUF1501 domain-containing protein [Gemmataceae bacterium]|nr:DUF1501 domain-containing protein [Gemmataceae bacterium]